VEPQVALLTVSTRTLRSCLGLPTSLSWFALVGRSLHGFRSLALDARCAQFAYYSLFAIVHLLIVLIAALAQLPWKGVLESFVEATGETLPPEAAAVILSQIEDIQRTHATSLSIWAVAVFAYTGSRLFITVNRGLNAAYGVEEKRRGWQVHSLALVVTAGSFILFITALVLMVVGPELSQWLTGRSRSSLLGFFMYRGVRWTVICLVVFLNSLLIYWLAPNVRQRWSCLWLGSLFVTAAWVAISQGLQCYVVNFGRYNEVYGALGGVIVLMLWLYLTGVVLLMGGKINSVIYLAQQEAAAADVKKTE
jgi:membrane protein